jgi:hypothetical protein
MSKANISLENADDSCSISDVRLNITNILKYWTRRMEPVDTPHDRYIKVISIRTLEMYTCPLDHTCVIEFISSTAEHLKELGWETKLTNENVRCVFRITFPDMCAVRAYTGVLPRQAAPPPSPVKQTVCGDDSVLDLKYKVASVSSIRSQTLLLFNQNLPWINFACIIAISIRLNYP